MKKTMLTCDTLDRFEAIVDVSALTAEQIEKAEFNAYCANMCRTGATIEESRNSAWAWFVHLVNDVDCMGFNLKP